MSISCLVKADTLFVVTLSIVEQTFSWAYKPYLYSTSAHNKDCKIKARLKKWIIFKKGIP